MKVDPLLTIALSVCHNPGVYALLLGSGVSRGARVPTGWEVFTDLIRKLALVQNGQEPQAPAAWYREQAGKEPSYTEIMGKLAYGCRGQTFILGSSENRVG